MINIPTVPKPSNPVLFDIPVSELQDSLKAKLSWLNYSFGRSQKLTRKRSGKTFSYPAVHIRDNNYQSVLPGEDLGNFSFFTIFDPQQIDFNRHTTNILRTKYALTFWFNVGEIYSESTSRETELIKAEILKTITRDTFLTSGRISVDSIMEEARNVYKEYSIDELDSQYLMHPYAALRFEGELLILESCTVGRRVLQNVDGEELLNVDGTPLENISR